MDSVTVVVVAFVIVVVGAYCTNRYKAARKSENHDDEDKIKKKNERKNGIHSLTQTALFIFLSLFSHDVLASLSHIARTEGQIKKSFHVHIQEAPSYIGIASQFGT